MANSSGVSGPFNPTIGLNLAQNGTAAPLSLIGFKTTDISPAMIAGKWQQAAAGNFVGVQSTRATPMGYNQQLAQAVPPVHDFDAAFVAMASDVSGSAIALTYRAAASGGLSNFAFLP
jgi:hypothetical protein